MPIDPTSTAADALRAIEAFIDAMREAQEMAERGVVGREMDEVLLHGKELLGRPGAARAEREEISRGLPGGSGTVKRSKEKLSTEANAVHGIDRRLRSLGLLCRLFRRTICTSRGPSSGTSRWPSLLRQQELSACVRSGDISIAPIERRSGRDEVGR